MSGVTGIFRLTCVEPKLDGRAEAKLRPTLHAEVVGEGFDELDDEVLLALAGAPPIAVVPGGVVRAYHVNLEIGSEPAIDAAGSGGVPDAGDDDDFVGAARPKKCDVMPGFVDRALGSPVGR